MRTMMITVRERAVTAQPWLHWVAPGTLGGADALNIIQPSPLLYIGLLVVAATITTSSLVNRRLDRVAERAQVARAMMYGYQLGIEHRDELRAAESRPVAVGENTVALPRRLQTVKPPADAAANDHVYRSQNVTKTVPMPAQSTRRARLASAQPPQPQP